MYAKGAVLGVYIYSDDITILFCLARGRFPRARVFFGDLCIGRKVAWKSFGGSVMCEKDFIIIW